MCVPNLRLFLWHSLSSFLHVVSSFVSSYPYNHETASACLSCGTQLPTENNLHFLYHPTIRAKYAACITDGYTFYYYFGRAALLLCTVVVSIPVSRLFSLHLSPAGVVASPFRPTLIVDYGDGLIIYFRINFNLI